MSVGHTDHVGAGVQDLDVRRGMRDSRAVATAELDAHALARVLERLPTAVVLCRRGDAGWLLEYTNARAEALLGAAPRSEPARALAELFGDGLPLLERTLAVAQATNAPVVLEIPASSHAHTSLTLAVTATTVSPGTIVAVLEDVTKRIDIAVEVAGAHATLARKLQVTEAQLWQAQKMESVARLAPGVAHDFNNILSVMRLNAQVGREIAPTADVTELFDEVETAAERGTALTKQLLAFSRHEAVLQGPLDLGHVIVGLEPLLRRLLGEHCSLHLQQTTTSPPIVIADRSQVEQVVMNLAVNAKDAIGDAGTLTIDVRDSGPLHVEVTVKDDGAGMTAETAARAFEPFFTTKADGKGTGLGLATTHAIVERIGGTTRIESKLGFGTSIILRLPRSSSATSMREATPRPRRASDAPASVLLLEDDELVRKGMARLLRRASYDVFEAATVAQAECLLDGHPIGVLVADVTLPDGDGIAFARKAVERGRTLRALFVSGHPQPAIRSASEEEDGLHFLQKPASAEAFLASLTTAAFDSPLTAGKFARP